MKATIFFIYNANSGVLNGALDSLHKLVSPSTYPCSLCAITHGYFGQKEVWKRFTRELGRKKFNLRFLHKDEMGEWPLNFSQLPAIYLLANGRLDLIASSNDLQHLESPNELIDLMCDRLNLVNVSRDSTLALRTH